MKDKGERDVRGDKEQRLVTSAWEKAMQVGERLKRGYVNGLEG